MALEDVQPGVASDGNGLVVFVPAIANPAAPTVAELTGGTVKKLTYGLTPDGFRHDSTIATITSGRYTLAQVLEIDGQITDTLEVQYVYTNDDTEDVVRTTLTPGVEGFIVHRLGYANEDEFAADQKVDVVPVKASIQRRVAPTANTELSIVQKLNVTGRVERFVEVAA
jgi:hypothetical protein